MLPGVTVTATSPNMIAAATAVTDETGYYRLINLPPGEYAVTAELQGFRNYQRQGIVLRGGANFQVDIVLEVGAVAETITVTGDSPMLEVSKPGNVLNIDGEFQKQMPLAARKNWTDFLEQTPGVHSRPFDDGSGRSVYFGHATEHFAHVVQLEGMQAGNYNDFQLTYVQMGSDMIEDTQVKTGGSDASTPMGTGLAINVITKSGGNTFRGTAGYAYQPLELGAATTPTTRPCSTSRDAARPAFNLPQPGVHLHRRHARCRPNRSVRRLVRRADHEGSRLVLHFVPQVGGRDPDQPQLEERQRHQGYYPSAELFPQEIKGYQPYVKVTSRLGAAHELSGFFQRDRTHGQSNWQYYYDPINVYSNGGNVYSAKITSAWGDRLTTTFSAGYNNKRGNDNDTYEAFGFDAQGPNISIFDGTRISSGFITGNSLILEGGNNATRTNVPASLSLIRGDLTYYKAGWGGNHEFGTGFFLEPQNIYDQVTAYTNDGFFRSTGQWSTSTIPR